MMNSDFIQEQAQIFADYLKQSGGPELKEQVSLALSRVTQRPATEAEVEQGLALIASLQKDNGMSEDQARVYFCLLALNLNELIYLD
jgi:hypothetical protein